MKWVTVCREKKGMVPINGSHVIKDGELTVMTPQPTPLYEYQGPLPARGDGGSQLHASSVSTDPPSTVPSHQLVGPVAGARHGAIGYELDTSDERVEGLAELKRRQIQETESQVGSGGYERLVSDYQGAASDRGGVVLEMAAETKEGDEA